MSDKVNQKGLILNPHMNGSFKLKVDSYITFSNLPIPLWISLQYNSEHCQQPPFKISTSGDRKVAFLTDNCNVSAEAIFTENVYGSRDLYFLISKGTYIPKFNLSYRSEYTIIHCIYFCSPNSWRKIETLQTWYSRSTCTCWLQTILTVMLVNYIAIFNKIIKHKFL